MILYQGNTIIRYGVFNVNNKHTTIQITQVTEQIYNENVVNVDNELRSVSNSYNDITVLPSTTE